MPVEIKYDANQQYQRDAIDSVVELFAGQDGGLDFNHTVFGNALSLSPETLQANLRRVQDKPVVQQDGSTRPSIPEADRQAFGETALDFSVEMETGTGKTYVYIRTIAELHQKYGWTKFVIVVPSVAIREGVIATLEMLKVHIAENYDGQRYTPYLYSSARLGGVRSFATSPGLQIMVINIDAFATAKTIMNKPVEAMGYCKPIEFVRACRPIVILDEPQNMETGPRQEAIASLWPLFTVRYSATHRDLKHLVYRLTPVDAYDMRLVKRIGVLSITKDDDVNDAYVEVTKINAGPGGVTATAKIQKGIRISQVILRKGNDLLELSGGRSVYRGWSVEDIHAGRDGGIVAFSNGRRVREGVGTSGDTEQQQRLMIRQAVGSHFEKELQLRLQRNVLPAAIKPLTLFFIDKVANYHPADGKFRLWFEQEYEFISSDERFRSLSMPAVADVHDGYFATNAKGEPKDMTFGRDTKDAESAFERIVKNKEKLLSFDEKLRFIFSHSALVEGWDNPNVFTICNLQDGRSEMRKRQQIGRGLRLPVMENGERCRVDDINLVTIVAHEEFSKFADDLQREIEEETGVSFVGRISDLKKDKTPFKERGLNDPVFQQLWNRIARKTTYRLRFETDDVVAEAVAQINAMAKLEPIKFRISKTEVDMNAGGVVAGNGRDRGTVEVEGARRLPDVVGELSRRLPLSRATIVRILKEIDNLDQVRVNPSVFIDKVQAAVNQALHAQVTDGIVYTPVGDERWSTEVFRNSQRDETVVAFASMEQGDFLKLPGWFHVPTPLGDYNPDRAVVRGDCLYLVRETEGTDKIQGLQWRSEAGRASRAASHDRSDAT